MTQRMEEFVLGFEKIMMTGIKGKRKYNVTSFNPIKASPGQKIYVSVPKLTPSMCIVPSTFRLSAKFVNDNTKSWFLNNLGKLLCEELIVKVGGEVVYANMGESVFSVYEDLWASNKERVNMIEYGIANENTRKLMSGNDSGDATVYSDNAMFTIYGNVIKIKLDKVLYNHELYAPYNMNLDIEYIITLPKADKIMVAQSGEKVVGYSLEDIELEYETIENIELANKVIDGYTDGRSLRYNYVTLLRTEEWGKNTTLVNVPINLPRKSMKAIIMLFKEGTLTDSESYIYPKINNVEITIEGIPNAVYGGGMKKSMFFYEAKRFYLNRKKETLPDRDYIFDDKFAFVIDLRTFNDYNVTGTSL